MAVLSLFVARDAFARLTEPVFKTLLGVIIS